MTLVPALIAQMSSDDAIDHAGDLARWLIQQGARDRASRALDELESAWWGRYIAASGGRVPTQITGGLGTPIGPQELVDVGEREASGGHHETARKVLGVAHLMIQMMLSDVYEQQARAEESAAALGDPGRLALALGQAAREADYERLLALRARILNVYPRLAAELARSGELVRASGISAEGRALTQDIAARYTLADLPDITSVAVPVGAAGTTTRRAVGTTRAARTTTAAAPGQRGERQATPPPPAPAPDRIVEGRPPFEGGLALQLRANHYVHVRSERYAVSELLTRAQAWAQNLFGAVSSIIVLHGDEDGVVRYYAAALDEDLRETFPTANPLGLVPAEVSVPIDSLPHEYHIMAIHVGGGVAFWPSLGRKRAYDTAVARENRLARQLGTDVTILAPELVRTNVFSRINTLLENEDQNLEEAARLLSQLDATAFATLSSDERFVYFRVLLRAWTLQPQERAVVQLMRSVESRTELDALIQRLRDANHWEALIDDLDHELWSLLSTVGEKFGTIQLTLGEIYQIMADNKLLQIGTPLPGLSIGPNGLEFSLDVMGEIEEAANSFLRFVEGFWDAIVMLVTRPDKIIEGLAQLAKMILVFKAAEMGYPKAMEMRDGIVRQFGRQLANGFKGIDILGVGPEVIRRIKWAIIWEVASFFVGIGEIRAALTAMGVSARVGAVARFLRLLGIVGRVAETEDVARNLSRLASILGRSGRVARTEEEVLVALSHLPDDEAGRLARALEGVEIGESTTMAALRGSHPELAGLAERSLRRAEIVEQLAAKAGGFSDDVARAFLRMSQHSTEDVARIVSHIPRGEGERFVRMLGMITDDAALAGPRGAATLEVLAQSTSRMHAVERFGFGPVNRLMQHTGRDGATLDRYLEALAAIERDLPEATRASSMQRLAEQIGRGDADSLARLDAKVAERGGRTAARAPERAIPHWQEEYIQDVLQEAEARGMLHGDRSAREAAMRAQIRGRSEDEVMQTFRDWDRQLELGGDIAEHALPPPGAGHVDVPTQDLPGRGRGGTGAAEAAGTVDRSARRVEVGAADLQAFRARHPQLAQQRHTVGVARSDVRGFDGVTLEGASPRPRTEAGLPPQALGPVESPSGLPWERFHAEQDLANQFVARAERLGITQAEVEGRTLAMHISNPRGVCWVCRASVEDPRGMSGVLEQLSRRYPGLTIRVTVEGPPGAEVGYRALIFNSGRLLFQL